MSHSNFKDSLVFKIIIVMIGLLIMSFGSGILRSADLGVDPFTSFNVGLASTIGSTLGNTQLVTNIIVFVLVIIADRKSFGIGSILNMVLVGYMVQYFIEFTGGWGLNAGFMPKFASLIIGILLFTLGATMYMVAGLGQSPYDAVAPIITEKSNAPYQSVRRWQDIIVVAAAFFLGGPVGIGTIICAFGTGPLISMWNTVLAKAHVA